jgi:hypothetical protein
MIGFDASGPDVLAAIDLAPSHQPNDGIGTPTAPGRPRRSFGEPLYTCV